MSNTSTRGEAMAETYPMPKDGYTCFHCGDRFTTIGAASDHFGGTQGATAACKIKFGDELGLVMELRKAEASRDEWMEQALQGRNEVEKLESKVESLTSAMQSYEPFRECHSINDVFLLFDSVEGRAIAAEGKLRDFGPYDDTEPILAALSMLESDLDATDRQRQIARMAIGALTAPSHSEAAAEQIASCAICGGARVRIRGRYPKQPHREVCPTCLAERMDEIQQVSGMDYGAAVTERQPLPAPPALAETEK